MTDTRNTDIGTAEHQDAEQPASARLIAIGDIHGCLNPLTALVEKISPTKDDTLIFLGDYVDRGPDSKGVIDYLLKLRDAINCVFLMGNHEVMMLDYLDFGSNSNWDVNGGKSTLDSYRDGGDFHIPESHIKFLSECKFYYETEKYFFVHGGLKPTRSIAQNLKYLKPIDFVWEREHLDPEHLFRQDYPWEKTVVCGHTPRPEPVILDKLISLDTGCVYNQSPELGRLTAIRLPSLEIVQVDNRAVKFSFRQWFSSIRS
jgi:serine/threonine protein phosphatase 1